MSPAEKMFILHEKYGKESDLNPSKVEENQVCEREHVET